MDSREARFGRLFKSCYSSLHAFARRRAPVADADDIVAEVLTVAWRRLDDIPTDAELPWLYGVAHRVLLNHVRTARRRVRLVERVRGERLEPPGSAPTDSAVLAALERLRDDDREVLRLAAWEGLQAIAIAVVLGCSPNAAALRLSRARARLRAELTGTPACRTGHERKVTDA
ncbi:MAG: RNA polymerase sigma factor [Acidimicrobiia bacterium]|nr:RNA polymerase sigma factor [Acidimicrobiia bacterium]